MLAAWMHRWWANKWVLVLSKESIWGFQLTSTSKQLVLHHSFTIVKCLSDPSALSELKKALPKYASLIVSLSSDFFFYQSFGLDHKLTSAEARSFIIAKLMSAMKLDSKSIAFSFEHGVANSDETSNYLVGAINKKHLTPLSQLVQEHKCSCVRLESALSTIAWWSIKQNEQLTNGFWGIVELNGNTLSLLFLAKQKVLCQRSFVIEGSSDIIRSAMQKVKQVHSLLQETARFAIFCSPSLFRLLTVTELENFCSFHCLSAFEYAEGENQSFNEMHFHYLATAIVKKSCELD